MTGTADSAPSLLVRGLRKRYADVVAVDGLDLEIRAGECFGLLGPNGAGKTTTIEICEGLTEPDEGEVLVLGRRWGEHDRELRELLGISLQETQFSEKLTVEETVRLFRSFYRRGPSTGEVIGTVQLQEKRDRAGRPALRRTAPAAGPRLRPGGRPLPPLPRRAHHRTRSPVPPPALGADRAVQGRRPRHPAHHPLYGRGRAALRPGRDRGSRPGDRARHAAGAGRLAQRRACGRVRGGAPERRCATSRRCARLDGVEAAARRDGTYRIRVAELHRTVPALLAELRRQGVQLTELRTHSATLEDVFVELTGRHLREE